MADNKEAPYYQELRKEIDVLTEEMSMKQGQIDDIQHTLDLINEKLSKLEISISQLLTIFNAGAGFFTVIRWMGVTFKWFAIIGSVITGFYLWVKSGWR